MRDIIEETTEIRGDDSSTDSAMVEHAYDTLAETGDDETFDEWGRVGPETAAAILKNYVPRQSRILHAACGSGLTGTALRNRGYGHIEGVNICAKLSRSRNRPVPTTALNESTSCATGLRRAHQGSAFRLRSGLDARGGGGGGGGGAEPRESARESSPARSRRTMTSVRSAT